MLQVFIFCKSGIRVSQVVYVVHSYFNFIIMKSSQDSGVMEKRAGKGKFEENKGNKMFIFWKSGISVSQVIYVVYSYFNFWVSFNVSSNHFSVEREKVWKKHTSLSDITFDFFFKWTDFSINLHCYCVFSAHVFDHSCIVSNYMWIFNCVSSVIISLSVKSLAVANAFDPVSRTGLFAFSERNGCWPKLLKMVISFHKGRNGTVQFRGSFSDPSPINNGLKQGRVLTPTLFGSSHSHVFRFPRFWRHLPPRTFSTWSVSVPRSRCAEFSSEKSYLLTMLLSPLTLKRLYSGSSHALRKPATSLA